MTGYFIVGRFLVRIGLRHDNPAFPSYLIYANGKYIGKQFSLPSESDCIWIERTHGVYSAPSNYALQRNGWTAATERRRRMKT